MLTYDTSGRCFGLTLVFQWHGSVVPRAMPQATLSLIICVLTHQYWCDQCHTVRKVPRDDMVSDPYSHQILGMILAFLLVFRSGTAYNRYWEGVTTMHTLTSKLQDLAYQAKWFTRQNNTSAQFQCEMARYLRLFYATVMQELNRDGEAPADIEAFNCCQYFHKNNWGELSEKGRREYELLLEVSQRPPVVMSWISALVVQRFQQGGIDAMPPVYSRMFQQMSEAMVGYTDALKIVNTPIPFPYSQMNCFVLYCFCLSWPVMCAVMVPLLEWAAAISFLVVLAFFSIEHIATELQDPFGDDSNDLPLSEHMCKFEYEVESLMVLDGTCFPEVTGFRTPLTTPPVPGIHSEKQGRANEQTEISDDANQNVGESQVHAQPRGPFVPGSNEATAEFDAQCVKRIRRQTPKLDAAVEVEPADPANTGELKIDTR